MILPGMAGRAKAPEQNQAVVICDDLAIIQVIKVDILKR
jgi:hypothetical protein